MSLTSLNLKGVYSSEDSDLLKDLYLPLLQHATRYDRAVGYFSSNLLVYASQGISALVRNKGRMRLVIGEVLDSDEYEAIKRGYQERDVYDRLDLKLQRAFEEVTDNVARDQLKLLSWMVAKGYLDIKIAFTVNGIYHDKIGIVGDGEGNLVVFQGSANETVAAFSPGRNSESISVYPSWRKDVFELYGDPHISAFDRLWRGNARGITTVALPSSLYESLVSAASDFVPGSEEEAQTYLADEIKDTFPSIPTTLGLSRYELQTHQRWALNQWKAYDYAGIWTLATGAGKTVAALHGATRLAETHRAADLPFILIVSVPYQVLADQWVSVMKRYNIDAIRCYRDRRQWAMQLEDAIATTRLEPRFVAIVVVNATLRSADFRDRISRAPENRVMFVGDECHHHAEGDGAPDLPKARYRLGLSATPWTAKEEERELRLREYYGPIAATYSIAHALADKVLVPYSYTVTYVHLTADEADQYREISSELAQVIAASEGKDLKSQRALHLAMQRNRLIGSAEAKFVHLANMLRDSPRRNNVLVYCGDGSTELDEDEHPVRDMERVMRLLYNAGWKASRFTAKESLPERERILTNFAAQHINAVAAIRVLDEGFDMPNCREAFLLASSQSARQYIQRRGRILRTAPGKSEASIHDFLVLPPFRSDMEEWSSLIQRELRRAYEFARYASNEADVVPQLQQLAREAGISWEDVELAVHEEEITPG